MGSSDRTPFCVHDGFVGRPCCCGPTSDLGFLADPLARERNVFDSEQVPPWDAQRLEALEGTDAVTRAMSALPAIAEVPIGWRGPPRFKLTCARRLVASATVKTIGPLMPLLKSPRSAPSSK